VTNSDGDNSASNLDKVRDLLFGEHTRKSERRLATLEERFARDLADARAEWGQRASALEDFWSKGLDAVNKRLKEQAAETAQADKELGRQIAELGKQLGKQAQALEQHGKQLADLQKSLHDEAKALRAEFAQRMQAAAKDASAEFDDLRGSKVDRAALAELLSELAAGLIEKKSGK